MVFGQIALDLSLMAFICSLTALPLSWGSMRQSWSAGKLHVSFLLGECFVSKKILNSKMDLCEIP